MARDPAPVTPLRKRRLRVLIVEDDERVRTFIVDALRAGAELAAAIGRVTSGPRSGRPLQRGAAEAAIDRAIAFIGEHYTEPLSLRDLASMAAMSGPHFCRVFRARVGVSLRDYVRGLRLERAQQLLLTSRLSLTDIALEVGFYDLPHFDKAFRKRFGISPTGFQRRNGQARLRDFGQAQEHTA